MEFHKFSGLFPLMAERELADLAADIKANGLREPVVMFEGQILDGRNRYRACELAGVQCRFTEYDGDDPLGFVVSLNLHRRHLDAGQRAGIAVDVMAMFEEQARLRQSPTYRALSPNLDEVTGRSDEQAGAMFGVSRGYVAEAKRLKQEHPDLFDALKAGTMTLQDIKRALKEGSREEIRESNRTLIATGVSVPLSGVYSTIVIDPPWDWGDEGDVDQFGRATPVYATMPLDKIQSTVMDHLNRHSDANAHLYLWITNRSLYKGFRLLDAWGFRYVTMITWVKPSIGMGNYFRGTTEHILFGIRGSLPLLRNDVGTHFNAPRTRRHSEKPEEFFKLVESCSPGPWLELFSRNQRPGWTAWGAEAHES